MTLRRRVRAAVGGVPPDRQHDLGRAGGRAHRGRPRRRPRRPGGLAPVAHDRRPRRAPL